MRFHLKNFKCEAVLESWNVYNPGSKTTHSPPLCVHKTHQLHLLSVVPRQYIHWSTSTVYYPPYLRVTLNSKTNHSFPHSLLHPRIQYQRHINQGAHTINQTEQRCLNDQGNKGKNWWKNISAQKFYILPELNNNGFSLICRKKWTNRI